MLRSSSLVIDQLSDQHNLSHLISLYSNSVSQNGSWKFNLAYVYCDYRDRKSQTITHLIGSLVSQLLASTYLPISVFEEIISICESGHKERKPFDLQFAHPILLTIMRYTWVCVCVDALDELEPATQKQFLDFWRQITSDPQLQSTIGQELPRLFLTGLHHVQEIVNRCLQSTPPTQVELLANESDIRKFLESFIDQDWNSNVMNEKLKEDIIETVVSKSDGMYDSIQTHLSCAVV